MRFLAAECGIRQFLDIGTGLPAPGSTHQVAQAVAPECRIAYIDNDPLVLVHARALLTSTAQGSCDYVEADLRDTPAVVAGAARTLDFTCPTAVLLLAVLHFIPESDDPAGIVAALVRQLAPGSYVVISHLTGDFAPGPVTAGGGRLQRAGSYHPDPTEPRPSQLPLRWAAAGAARGGPAHRVAPDPR